MPKIFNRGIMFTFLIGFFLLTLSPSWAEGSNEPKTEPNYQPVGNCSDLKFEDIQFYNKDFFVDLAYSSRIDLEKQYKEYEIERELQDFFMDFSYLDSLFPVFLKSFTWEKWDVQGDQIKELYAIRKDLLTKIRNGLNLLDKYKYDLFKDLKIKRKEFYTFNDQKENRSFIKVKLNSQTDLKNKDFFIFLLSTGLNIRNTMLRSNTYLQNKLFQVRGVILDWSFAGQEYIFTGGPGGLPMPTDISDLKEIGVPYELNGEPGDLKALYELSNDIAYPGKNPVDVYVLDTIPDEFKIKNADINYYPVNSLYKNLRDSLGIQFFMKQYPNYFSDFTSIANEKYCNTDLSDHGIYIAGIIKQLAPRANIHLLEVLNHQGSGSLSSLLWGFREILNERENNRNPFLINLSLTTKLIPHTSDYPYRAKLVQEFSKTNLFLAIFYALDDNSYAFSSLKQVMDIAFRHQGFITAATGNDSNKSIHFTAGYPASLGESNPNILAVGACNEKTELATYSNLPGYSGILAFGGEVDGFFTKSGNTSLYINPNYIGYSSFNKFGLAKWAGSSFATAVASGALAALLSSNTYMSVLNAKSILKNACYTNSTGMKYLPIF